jgi:ABC-2 type transport system permease protein
MRLIKKELLQTFRDKRMIGMIIIMPVLQLFLFAYVASTDVKNISMAVLDEDRTVNSRALVDKFVQSGYFIYKTSLDGPAQMNNLLDTGKAQIVVHIPRGFSKALANGRIAPLQLVLDGSDSSTAGIITGYANGVVSSYSAAIMTNRLYRARAMLPNIPMLDGRVRIWYNPELESLRFMVPGVLCFILSFITIQMTAMAIVREKEIGTLEQLIVTPITSMELIVGKTVPFLLIGIVDMLLVLVASVGWFGVHVAGSTPLLIVLAVLFMLSNLGIGIFISTVSNTLQEASVTSIFINLPSFLLSGFIFPVANMPLSMRWATYLIPLRYFLEIVRGIFLKGTGMSILWPQVLILSIFAVAILTASAARFSKRLG